MIAKGEPGESQSIPPGPPPSVTDLSSPRIRRKGSVPEREAHRKGVNAWGRFPFDVAVGMTG